MCNKKYLKQLPKDIYVHCSTLEQLEFLYRRIPYKGITTAEKMWSIYGANTCIGTGCYGSTDSVTAHLTIPFSDIYQPVRWNLNLKELL